MTVAFLSGTRRRATAAVAIVGAGLLTLSACEKPTPVATLTIGSESVNTEAACYNDGKPLAKDVYDACMKETGKTLEVDPDLPLRIGVDPAIAENGWVLGVEGSLSNEAEESKKTYQSVNSRAFFPPGGQDKLRLQIVEVKDQQPVGVWQFQLKKQG
ncbi:MULTISPECIES: DUF2771 family protein [Streptomyces]|uniref:DUF2771 domain-containing protein n=1 Tax=Streptomyces tsukubensis (strain DSM 42081 / NBRC 108919 / NRRL 18488 / 9993) TaxID=1114943 RepID=A0A7G3UIH1_STRT9|nr:DUF2771 family protein [Streptomyces tsukubensis]AZK94754.1 hypothetical protein B7R87_13435 [Streptomyces tsukubensis]QKM69165.1 DUF2771 domain-containing protein [Streptomyces tsukubensis NRRL18488]TAI42905.1 DUF2771 family protein [Streptomyces tsukubensis]